MVGTFDPATHLHKQGWKGKGTALKQGHATRPLAVVKKNNLSGIGRDRDEAVPFWDQIFAATAASIFSPTPSPGVSGTSTPLPSHAAHTSTRSWQTTTFSTGQASSPSATTNANSTVLPPVRAKTAGAPSTAARVGKEMARRGLYSRFLRGKVIVVEPEVEEEEGVIAGPSIITEPSTSVTVDSVPKSKKGKGKERETEKEDETKEERRARRAEKAKRKEEKAAKKASTGLNEPEVEGVVPVQEDEGRSKKKKRKAEEGEEEIRKKAKKDKKIRVDGEVEGDQAKKEKKERKGKKGKKDQKVAVAAS